MSKKLLWSGKETGGFIYFDTKWNNIINYGWHKHLDFTVINKHLNIYVNYRKGGILWHYMEVLQSS